MVLHALVIFSLNPRCTAISALGTPIFKSSSVTAAHGAALLITRSAALRLNTVEASRALRQSDWWSAPTAMTTTFVRGGTTSMSLAAACRKR